MSDENIQIIRSSLLEWSKTHYRNYPWRETSDPYQILIAEIMLQRTKADQVNIIYKNFIKKYPNLKSIYYAQLIEIQEDIKKLGLFRRGKNIKLISKILIEENNGKIPRTVKELTALPGIGDYISGAFLISAYQEKQAPLDSNIVRFISRYFGYTQTDNSRRKKKYKQKVDLLIPKKKPRQFLYALLDFAHFICRARAPECTVCCISKKCNYYLENNMLEKKKFD